MSVRSFVRIPAASAALLVVAAGPAAAHNGPHAASFVSGVLHTISSADHLSQVAVIGVLAVAVIGGVGIALRRGLAVRRRAAE
jgi:hydrogenase/urease accessory protein HupE